METLVQCDMNVCLEYTPPPMARVKAFVFAKYTGVFSSHLNNVSLEEQEHTPLTDAHVVLVVVCLQGGP